MASTSGCAFEVVRMNERTLTIRDIGHSCGFKSVTNDAENVVSKLHTDGLLTGRRLFYFDSEDRLGEIAHDGRGGFVRFNPLSL